MSSSDDEMVLECTPPELRAEAELAMNNLLPPKSKERYMTAYDNFISWKLKKKALNFSENVLLAYFQEQGTTKKSSTLWSLYSMIKATMHLKHNIDIKSYSNLLAWLKRQSDGYTAKKSRIFTSENVQTYLNQAPDDQYLATKVALILGITGACRAMELTNITTKDIEVQGDLIIFKLCDTKTKTNRSFVIRDEFMNIFNKYYALRPQNIATERLFLNYRNGKCTRQVIGRHKILLMPKDIATFLNLDNPQLYTGHCFRRTSATLLADSGANLLTVKRLGGWKSDKVAESYIDESVGMKQETTKNITKNIILARTPQQDTATSHEEVHSRPSLYTNPQPGCSRDPPVFIESHSLPKFKINSEPGLMSSVNYLQDLTQAGASNPMPSLPPQQEEKANEQSTSHTVLSQPGSSSEIQQTNISVPGKTITISISNCPNMTNLTFNIN